MSDSGSQTREELYRDWRAWVAEHLGRDPQRADAAAQAAAQAILAGEGFNGASEAARNAWHGMAPAPVLDGRYSTVVPIEPALTVAAATLILGVGVWFIGVGHIRGSFCGVADWYPYWLFGVPLLLEVGGWTAISLSGGFGVVFFYRAGAPQSPPMYVVKGRRSDIAWARFLAWVAVALGPVSFLAGLYAAFCGFS